MGIERRVQAELLRSVCEVALSAVRVVLTVVTVAVAFVEIDILYMAASACVALIHDVTLSSSCVPIVGFISCMAASTCRRAWIQGLVML